MSPLLMSAVLLGAACLMGWWRQVITRNAGHVDVIWSFGVGGTALLYLALGEGDLTVRVLTALLVGIWSVRLGSHIWRRVHGAEEEGRYRAIREHYGERVNHFHLFFFLSQGLLAWLFALPHWVIAAHPGGHDGWLWAGFALGTLALVGETVADRQLARFRRDPGNRGVTCRQGLWRYSRHPNYFFEWLHWFSYPLIAIGAIGAGWLWLAPLMMLLFLWFVTGIPYTELQAIKSRGDDYRHYQKTTSPFIPWRPKS
jgi:steroid 5-alpha reductase family enzyme